MQASIAREAAVAPESEKVSVMRMPLSLVPSMTTVEPARRAPARLSFWLGSSSQAASLSVKSSKVWPLTVAVAGVSAAKVNHLRGTTCSTWRM